MSITKIQSESLNLADTYDFTGTVTGAGGVNTPAFSVYSASGLASTVENVATKVPFDTEFFDTDNAYDTSTYRFTVPTGQGGKYFLFLKCRANSETDNDGSSARIYKNGTALTMAYGRMEFYDTFECVAIVDLSEADYIEAYFATQYGTHGVNGGSQFGSNFGGYKLIT